MQKIFWGIMFFASIFAISAKELVLAKDGKTDYQIVDVRQTDKGNYNAQLLAFLLKEKCGASFPIVSLKTMASDKKSIFIGAELSDEKGMNDQDHVVKCHGNDIHLYGHGYDADFYALISFMEKELGIHFYQRFVLPEIGKENPLSVTVNDRKESWAVKIRHLPQGQMSDYFRGLGVYMLDQLDSRRKKYIKNPSPAVNLVNGQHPALKPDISEVSMCHTAFRYISNANAPSGIKPYDFIKNKDYFKTDPDFFGMDRHGKRNLDMQLCFSNKKLRSEFMKNIEKHLKQLGTNKVMISVSYDDSASGIPCCCRGCKALEEKYKTPGGALFEYLLELGEKFRKTHPDTRISTLLYRTSQTQKPPVLANGKKFPDNLWFYFASIHDYTNRNWDHPDNKLNYEDLKAWNKLTDNIIVWMYYPHYGQAAFMPIAADSILVDNIRKAAKLGVKGFSFEFYPYNTGHNMDYMNFSDLNIYLFYRFCKNPDLDYSKEVMDFMNAVYGPAGKLAKQYHDELQACFTEKNPYGVILSASNFNRELSYLNPANLYRWQKMFDEMERLTAAGSPQIRKNVADLRRSLDYATYGNWIDANKAYPDYFKDPVFIRKRIGEPLHPSFGKPAAEYLKRSEMTIRYRGKEKPLPAEFRNIPADRIKRLVPRNTANYPRMSQIPKTVDDGEAAFGYAPTIDLPDLPFHFGYYINDTKTHGPQETLESWDIAPGKYKLYKLGEIQPTAGKCLIWFSSKSWCTNADLSEIADLADLGLKYDAWVSLKFPENYKGERNDLVLCDQIILIRKEK